ncbi:hypothetical protein AAHE18_02G110000 [Arachis hypogaea]
MTSWWWLEICKWKVLVGLARGECCVRFWVFYRDCNWTSSPQEDRSGAESTRNGSTEWSVDVTIGKRNRISVLAQGRREVPPA